MQPGIPDLYVNSLQDLLNYFLNTLFLLLYRSLLTQLQLPAQEKSAKRINFDAQWDAQPFCTALQA